MMLEKFDYLFYVGLVILGLPLIVRAD